MFLIDARADCVDCEWHTEGKNAMGNGAIYHRKTGHYVQCELYFAQHFGKPKEVESDKEKEDKQ